MRILLTMFLGLWMAVGPGFRVAAAADAPLERPATAGPIIVDSAIPAAPGQLSLQPFWSLTFVAGNLDGRAGGGWASAAIYRSLQIPIKVTYGLMQNMEIYAQMRVHPQLGRRGSWIRRRRETASASFSGVRDLAVILKYQLARGDRLVPHGIPPFLNTDFPTGHHFRTNPARLGTDFLGAGAFSWTAGANLSKWLGPVYLSSNLWYSIATREIKAPTNLGGQPAHGAGARPGPGHLEYGGGVAPDREMGGTAGVLQFLGGEPLIPAAPGAPQHPDGPAAGDRICLQSTLVLRAGGGHRPGRKKLPVWLYPYFYRHYDVLRHGFGTLPRPFP